MKKPIFGIGVGPGDPDLITLKAKRILEGADLIVYPAPENGYSIARKIAFSHFPKNCQELAIDIPMSPNRFPAMKVYESASEKILETAQNDKTVVILCEGDPFFYGSFMYLFYLLNKRSTVEVIPGVSSVMASSARLSSPLAARNDIFTVLPAPLENQILEQQMRAAHAFALVKVGRHFSRVYKLLQKLDLLNKALYIERATMDNEQILDINTVNPLEVPYFSIILVHSRARAWL
ncbi:MAG: precorrin-2 C(20)-methyltransferase [Rhodospirillaceae bacterium]|nr:precorrin-2 C(20)-methyltransferase [Rhodospirillaceae bacterium]